MKIVIAPDSFKDSLSATQVANAIAKGFAQTIPHAELVCVPMADGGEGTLNAVIAATGGEMRETWVIGPLGTKVCAQWGWLADSSTAIIEMAEASGIQLVSLNNRNACDSSTYGTGQLVLAALDAGAIHIVLAIGGSATNDAGSGMMRALGLAMYDHAGLPLPPGGAALAKLAHLDISNLDERLPRVRFEVAADVTNPLCGANGASAVFGPQKGASPREVAELDSALDHFADHVARATGRDERDQPGSGAAGGMGFVARAFLNAAFRPGVEVVSELSSLSEAIRDADLVITGEGRFDSQTLNGKTPFGVANIANRHKVPVVVLAGRLGNGYEALYAHGVSAAFSLSEGPMTLEQACTDAARLLTQRSQDIARLWGRARK